MYNFLVKNTHVLQHYVISDKAADENSSNSLQDSDKSRH